MTFQAWPIAVAFSMLDPSTGESLLRTISGITQSHRSAVIDDRGGGGFRQARRRGQIEPRQFTIRPAELAGDELDLVANAYTACNGLAGFFEWRAPGEDPSLFRFITEQLRITRSRTHAGSLEVIIEEHVTDG